MDATQPVGGVQVMMSRKSRVCGALLLSGLFALVLSGCGNGLKVGQGAYRGPSLGVDSSGEWHEVVATPPTPGWDLTLDGKRETADATQVFVTLRRPNPAAVYPQVVVEQRVLTPIRAGEPVELFARQIRFRGEDGAVYQRVPG